MPRGRERQIGVARVSPQYQGRFAFPSEMGHSSTRAAYIYQHRRSLRDKMIAGEISRRAEAEYVRSGIQRARGNQGPS